MIKKPTAKSVLFYIVAFLAVTLTNPLFSHSGATVLFRLFKRNITLESLCYGASTAATLVAVMLWCGCMGRVLTNDKMLYLISSLLPKIGLTSSCTLRFVPMFLRSFNDIEAAQKALGMYSGRGARAKLKTLSSVFSATAASAFEASLDTASAMTARGYGNSKRTSFSVFRFKAHDAVFAALTLLLAAIAIISLSTPAASFEFYPVMSKLRFTTDAFVSYIAYALLSLLPFFTELKEAAVWKYSISKI